jgi:single-stranded DNA-binding protein
MSVLALVTGQLYRPPEQRTSKAGKLFVAATLKVKDGEAAQWWRVTAFSETAQAELMRPGDGDGVAVQGPFKAELYDKDGEHRVSLNLVADQVLALRPPPRKRGSRFSPLALHGHSARLAGSWQSPVDGPNDDIGF